MVSECRVWDHVALCPATTTGKEEHCACVRREALALRERVASLETKLADAQTALRLVADALRLYVSQREPEKLTAQGMVANALSAARRLLGEE